MAVVCSGAVVMTGPCTYVPVTFFALEAILTGNDKAGEGLERKEHHCQYR